MSSGPCGGPAERLPLRRWPPRLGRPPRGWRRQTAKGRAGRGAWRLPLCQRSVIAASTLSAPHPLPGRPPLPLPGRQRPSLDDRPRRRRCRLLCRPRGGRAVWSAVAASTSAVTPAVGAALASAWAGDSVVGRPAGADDEGRGRLVAAARAGGLVPRRARRLCGRGPRGVPLCHRRPGRRAWRPQTPR